MLLKALSMYYVWLSEISNSNNLLLFKQWKWGWIFKKEEKWYLGAYGALKLDIFLLKASYFVFLVCDFLQILLLLLILCCLVKC